MPLRGVAELKPVWQTSRIVHRNGIRTITVGAFAEEGVLASEVLAAAKPVIDTITLPVGYDIAYGGEVAVQTESSGHLGVGMIVSMVLIFLILLFQFQNLRPRSSSRSITCSSAGTASPDSLMTAGSA
jgi:multidrug efflux pump subunit AcrB